LQGFPIVFTSFPRQEIVWGNPLAELSTKLEIVPSPNPTKVVDYLISVLQGGLRRTAHGSNKQAQAADVQVWETGKLLRDRPTEFQSPVLQPSVVDSIRGKTPNMRQIEQSLVTLKIPRKRREREITNIRFSEA
jgi:hypothetical protein